MLRIGTTGDYAPYTWRDTATGTWQGSDIALARDLAARLGLRAEFVPTTWSTLATDAEGGRFDIALGGISVTPDRAGIAGFSRPYTSDRKLPVVRCGEQRRFDSAAEIDRPTTRLVVNPGGTNERFARATFPRAALRVHGDNRSVFEEVRTGRADVMVTDAVEGRLQEREQRGLCVAQVRARWASADKAIWVPGGAALRTAIDRELAAIGGARAYRRVLAAWESHAWQQPDAARTRLALLIDERLAVVVEVARAKWNSGAAIADPAREDSLRATMRAQGAARGLSPQIVDRFFAAQIEAAKQLQDDLMARWRRAGLGSFEGVPDLVRDIRPQIDGINSRMLDELSRLERTAVEMPVSTLSALSPRALRTARAGLAAAGT